MASCLSLCIKFYWHMAMPIRLHFAYGCFCTTIAESSSCDRDSLTCKAKYIYYVALY